MHNNIYVCSDCMQRTFDSINNSGFNYDDIMKMYKSEIGEAPFPRSEQNIRGLAQYRGGSANVRYAEAFQIIKMIG